jgi:hypothetical protein
MRAGMSSEPRPEAKRNGILRAGKVPLPFDCPRNCAAKVAINAAVLTHVSLRVHIGTAN